MAKNVLKFNIYIYIKSGLNVNDNEGEVYTSPLRESKPKLVEGLIGINKMVRYFSKSK